MPVKSTPLFLLALALFLLQAVNSHAALSVRLKNGETLKAESFKVNGGKVTLGYKMGEAEFPRSSVLSITSEEGGVDFLSSPGKESMAREEVKARDKKGDNEAAKGSGDGLPKPLTGRVSAPPPSFSAQAADSPAAGQEDLSDDEIFKDLPPEQRAFLLDEKDIFDIDNGDFPEN